MSVINITYNICADKMKPDILAKVANQCSSLYTDAQSSVTDAGQALPTNVASMCNTKKAFYEVQETGILIFSCCLMLLNIQVMAHFQQANVAQNAKKFGEEIARLKVIFHI